jgi:N-acetylglucosamine kinase-like BadF-type ATPase
MKYLIGIDLGGTKSELTAYDLKNTPIFNLIGGAGNPAVNLDKTVNNLISLIYDCVNELGRENCELIAVGMAGVETGNYAELIKKYVEGAFVIKTIVLNDAEMACKAYFGDTDGILAISGTGSSCFVQKGGAGEMVGGWGHILGDEGSGYHTVMHVFKNIVYKYDRALPFDDLSKAMIGEIGGSTRSDIMNFIYNNEKDKIAALFPIITDYAKEGDAYASMLLENAGKYLAELTVVAYNKKSFKGTAKIGLKGGIFHNSSFMFSAYMDEIQKRLSSYDIIKEDISTTKAVCNIYKTEKKGAR